MNWLKHNWFRLSLVIVAVGFLATYAYDRYQTHQPRTMLEIVERAVLPSVQKILDERDYSDVKSLGQTIEFIETLLEKNYR